MSLDNLNKFKELAENDPALKDEIAAVIKDAKSKEEAIEATLPIAERIGLPFTKNDVKKFFQLDDDELDEVAGGAWGHHEYHSQAVYNACGIETDWTKNPFVFDKFTWTAHKELKNFDKNDAAAVVFYHHVHGKAPKDLNEAYAFKVKNAELYKKDVDNSNLKA